MRCIVRTGRDDAEASRIKQLAADETGHKGFTFALAIRPAKGAQARFGGIAPVGGAKHIVIF